MQYTDTHCKSLLWRIIRPTVQCKRSAFVQFASRHLPRTFNFKFNCCSLCKIRILSRSESLHCAQNAAKDLVDTRSSCIVSQRKKHQIINLYNTVLTYCLYKILKSNKTNDITKALATKYKLISKMLYKDIKKSIKLEHGCIQKW